MRFGVLGPVEVWDGGTRVPVGGPQQRALLAVLLLNANHVVSADRLVDYLWGERPPARARGLLQGCVAGLRRALHTDQPLLTRAPGYLLRVAPGELDLDRFEERTKWANEASAAGTTDGLSRAVEHLSEALSLWRGPALDGVTVSGCRADALRLEERRLTVLEQRIDLELRLGRPAELVGELQEHVAAQPLRERLWAQLMLALCLVHRSADALAAYQRLRQTLVEQLGVEPGVTAQRLQRAILAGEDAVAAYLGTPGATSPPPEPARPVVPAQLPASPAAFAGRERELARLDELLAGADAGVRVGAISGMAGVGKTALALHWAHRVASRFPDGQLYVNLRGFDPTGTVMHPAEAVRGFLDALGVPVQRIPAGLDDQAALYRSLLDGRRMLVVLDNARDAGQVRPLLPGSPGCLVLVTSRDQLAGLLVDTGALLTRLDVLAPTDARTLLARRLGTDRVEAEPAAVDEILARCAGLPLALSIVAARAAVHPGFPLAAAAAGLGDGGRSLDAFDGDDPVTDLRAVFSWSYRALSPGAARLFRWLGLLPGPHAGTLAAASLVGTPVATAAASLAELARAHLVSELAPGRYDLHDLVRSYAAELAEQLDPEDDRRAALHRVLDHYLHSAYAAARLLEPHRVDFTLAPPAAGVTAEALTDRQHARDWLIVEHPVLLAAAELAGRRGFDVHAWQLAWTLVDFLDWRGQWHELVAARTTGLAAARRLDDRAIQAAAHRGIGRVRLRQGRYDEAGAHLRQALDLLAEIGDRDGQAHTHGHFTMLLDAQGRNAEGLEHAKRAYALFRDSGNQPGQGRALNSIGWFHARLGNPGPAIDYCERAIAMHQRLGNPPAEASAWDSLGYAYGQLGDHRQAIACLERAAELARQVGDRYNEADVLAHLGEAHLAAGDKPAARSAWQRSLSIFDQLGHARVDELRGRLRDL
jgi:DNA-binding SARP family transcriptional activator/Tfp pilus assembly protein PilF